MHHLQLAREISIVDMSQVIIHFAFSTLCEIIQSAIFCTLVAQNASLSSIAARYFTSPDNFVEVLELQRPGKRRSTRLLQAPDSAKHRYEPIHVHSACSDAN